MYVHIFEISQLEGSYVEDLPYKSKRLGDMTSHLSEWLTPKRRVTRVGQDVEERESCHC